MKGQGWGQGAKGFEGDDHAAQGTRGDGVELQEAWDGEDALKERFLGGNSCKEECVCRMEVWTRVMEKLGGEVHPWGRCGSFGRGR